MPAGWDTHTHAFKQVDFRAGITCVLLQYSSSVRDTLLCFTQAQRRRKKRPTWHLERLIWEVCWWTDVLLHSALCLPLPLRLAVSILEKGKGKLP